jgi:transketolase
MVVVVGCDAVEVAKATEAAAFNEKPTYLRFGRSPSAVFTTPDTPFKIGRAEIFRDPEFAQKKPDVAIIGCGMVLYNALKAAEKLSGEGIEAIVVNNHTVKPIDEKTIIDVAKRAGAVVTVEEHQVAGGMGSAVAEVLAQNHPVPIEFVGVHDRFGESGVPDELIEKFGMGVDSIVSATKKVAGRK